MSGYEFGEVGDVRSRDRVLRKGLYRALAVVLSVHTILNLVIYHHLVPSSIQ